MTWAKFGLGSFGISFLTYIVLFYFYGGSVSDELNFAGLRGVELPIVGSWLYGMTAKLTSQLWISLYKLSGAISVGCGFVCSIIWFYKGYTISALNREKISLLYWGLLSVVATVSFMASWLVFLPVFNQFLTKVFVLIAGPLVYILIGVICPADSMR